MEAELLGSQEHRRNTLESVLSDAMSADSDSDSDSDLNGDAGSRTSNSDPWDHLGDCGAAPVGRCLACVRQCVFVSMCVSACLLVCASVCVC